MVKAKWATFAITLQGPCSVNLIDLKHIKEHNGNVTCLSVVRFHQCSSSKGTPSIVTHWTGPSRQFIGSDKWQYLNFWMSNLNKTKFNLQLKKLIIHTAKRGRQLFCNYFKYIKPSFVFFFRNNFRNKNRKNMLIQSYVYVCLFILCGCLFVCLFFVFVFVFVLFCFILFLIFVFLGFFFCLFFVFVFVLVFFLFLFVCLFFFVLFCFSFFFSFFLFLFFLLFIFDLFLFVCLFVCLFVNFFFVFLFVLNLFCSFSCYTFFLVPLKKRQILKTIFIFRYTVQKGQAKSVHLHLRYCMSSHFYRDTLAISGDTVITTGIVTDWNANSNQIDHTLWKNDRHWTAFIMEIKIYKQVILCFTKTFNIL